MPSISVHFKGSGRLRKSLTKDIILFSTADWDNPSWTNKQHMAVHLADMGFRILYVESAGLRRPIARSKDFLRILRRAKKGLRGLQMVKDDIFVYSPLVIPIHGNPVFRRVNKEIIRGMIRLYCRRLGFKDPMFWTYNPMSWDIARKLYPSMLIYHCVDDLSSAPGMPADAIRREEKRLVRYADIVFATSHRLSDACSKLNSGNTHYFPNVVDFEHFSRALKPGSIPEELARIPSPRIGFVGAISGYKVDFDLIAYVARKRQDWHWVLIGGVGEGQPKTSVEKLRMSNIHLLGPKSYASLPEYLRGFDVAVIPAPVNDYTSSMFPMKFFEYLSAGKPVVSTNIPSLQDYAGVCALVDSPEDFIQAIEDVMAGTKKALNIKLGLETARKHTWQWRLDEMMKLVSSKWEHKYGRP